MTTIALLLALTASAEELADIGTALPNDPYHHNRALTQGRLAGFRELYVDPDVFAAALRPASAPPVTGATSVGPVPAEGGPLQLRLVLDPAKLAAAGISAETAVGAVRGAYPGVVAEGSTLSLTGDAAALGGLYAVVLSGKTGFVRVTGLGAVEVLEPVVAPPPPTPEELAAQAAAEAEAAKKKKKGQEVVVAPPPPPPEPKWLPAVTVPATLPGLGGVGDLAVENDRSSWATVAINGEKLGIIGPFTVAYVRGVQAGGYAVEMTVANGFTWTRSLQTVAPGATVAAPKVQADQ